MRRRLIALLLLAAAGCRQAPPATPAGTEAQQAYDAAAARMHEGLAAADADPDVAFARGMIPHHRGAIDMARVELRYGRDPAMRRLAEQVIAAQDVEIASLEAWLAARGGPPAAGRSASDHAHSGPAGR